MENVTAARALGWASIGIGLTEIVATGMVEKMLGVHHKETLLRSFGVREITSGVSILTQKEPTQALAAGLWSRVAGDAIDIAALGMAAKKSDNPSGLAVATAMVLGITALDVLVAGKVQQAHA